MYCCLCYMCVCCEGDGNAGVVSVSTYNYMGSTRGSGVLASAGDLLEMSVVRGVGGVCHGYVFGSGRGWRCWV